MVAVVISFQIVRLAHLCDLSRNEITRRTEGQIRQGNEPSAVFVFPPKASVALPKFNPNSEPFRQFS